MAKATQPATRKPTTAVAKSSSGRSEVVPEFMRKDVGRGTEQIDTSDLDQPRLKLIQSTNKELDQYNDLRPGMFFHVAQERIIRGPLLVVPIFFQKRYLLWNPLDSGGGILARSDDAETWSPPNQTFTVKLDKKNGGGTVKWTTAPRVDQSGLTAWGTMNPDDPNSPPAATLMYDYLLGFPEEPDLLPAVFTFQRSAIKSGKKFNTRLKTESSKSPIFGMLFEFDTEKASNNVGQQYYKPMWSGAGFLNNTQLYADYERLNASLSAKGMRIRDEESLQAEAEAEGEEEAEDEQEKGGRRRPRI